MRKYGIKISEKILFSQQEKRETLQEKKNNFCLLLFCYKVDNT